MGGIQVNLRGLAMVAWILFLVLVISDVGIAERLLKHKRNQENEETQGLFVRVANFLWQDGKSAYEPVWPEMKFGWKIVVGSIVGFLGAALGSVGGVGGGGIFVPMLSLIIGFDPKSSTAISKCMIMGAAGSTVYYNLRLRHPTLEMPLIDYDLALLFQPMLMLGISIGVALNVMFADWMVTVLLIILFIVHNLCNKVYFSLVWVLKFVNGRNINESLIQRYRHMEERDNDEKGSCQGGIRSVQTSCLIFVLIEYDCDHPIQVPLLQNIYWKELSSLVYVWIGFLIVQIIKEYLPTCSVMYWIVTSLQIPIAASVTIFEAICLCKGTRVIASKGKEITNWKMHQILLYCSCGIIAGMVGGLLGLGGGFILGPLFLELGIPPQVASATSTFSMVFSSSMSVVQYYLLDRFPVPYAAYFVLVATIAAIAGQHVVRRIIAVIGRASIIIFILALTIFISAVSLGGVGIADMVKKLANKEYMGFENLCKA
ncbi:DNA-directed RNA polymerase isoform 2 [Gossypium australe]|uniref:DNA-directed RNA polymerase isoform 2 n=1 Tax=Gossypium australe TaxID=47621 RepID=A0A5B6VZN3_9ROSI|nr:DNA-directed RNA polymerase isoform 2 [Gossypium australe]